VRRKPHHLLTTNSADTPLKGLRYLLEAVRTIRKRRPIHLTVVGEPKKDGVVAKLVKSWKLEENIHFTGRIGYEEFAGYYAQSTLAVIPSLYEGFGMPAGEAMACGTPVISTTGGALPEVVGDAGILVPPGDSHALVGAIEELLDNPNKGDELGKAGLRRVMNSLTWEHAARKTVDVYRETIDADRRFQ
jgi:glycosyltransferase involved in cell wall biosynthesis